MTEKKGSPISRKRGQSRILVILIEWHGDIWEGGDTMPRKPRVEYSGAVYHVMCRGNGGQAIFADDLDRGMFLDVLDEVCERCGWRIHAYVLMGNHYHVLLETPEPNLVAGMKWLQGHLYPAV